MVFKTYRYFHITNILEFLLAKCIEENNDVQMMVDRTPIKKALVDILLLFISKSDKVTKKFRENTNVNLI